MNAMDKLNDAYDNLTMLQDVNNSLWRAYTSLKYADEKFKDPLEWRIECCIDRVVEFMHTELDRAGEAIGAMMDERSERTAQELRKAFEEVEE